jgi:hypothetical protein
MTKHYINLEKDPFIPSYLSSVESHIKGDKKWEWNQNEVELFLSDEQESNYQIGTELQKEIKNPLNVNVLDYLLKHKELIPEEWKRKFVYFWGTIYRDSGGGLYVRYLCWCGVGWGGGCGWLGFCWRSDGPAAVRASSPLTSETLPLDTLSLELKEVFINGVKYIKAE